MSRTRLPHPSSSRRGATGSLPRASRDLRRAVRKNRRLIVSLVACALAAWALGTLMPLFVPGVPVVVTSHALEEGDEISAGDLEVRTFRPGTAPDGAFSSPAEVPEGPVSRSLTGGIPVTAGDVDNQTVTVSPGQALVEIPLSSTAIAGILAPGMAVSITCTSHVTNAIVPVMGVISAVSGASAKEPPTSAFASQASTSIVVEIALEDLPRVTGCTPANPPLVAVVG